LEVVKIKIRMNSERLRQLLAFASESPDDPFIQYALAMEYRSEQPQEAKRIFGELLHHHPDYLPTYYQAAALCEQQGRTEDALKLYQAGIELAIKQNDRGALKELRAAYELLIDE
jgi:tetratricopeptide (TPR) repeat protein